uniref:Putative LOC100743977 [Bombus impatiens] n=1 Tax=Lepeophtheirus salmonis TaxID=72036 RepID=A0A0K2TI61_LEPSM
MEEESLIKTEPLDPESPRAYTGPPGGAGTSPYLISDILSSHHHAPTSTTRSPPNMSMLGSASLFQPFLQHLAVVATARALPFSIDNILNPNFGGISSGGSSPPPLPPPSIKNERPVDLSGNPSRDSFSTPSSPGGDVVSSSPSKTLIYSTNNNNFVKAKEPALSSTTSPLSSNENPPSSAGDESPKKDDSDVPPGMVRGPNGQLWPAWVFCTRYSDRPSSGKNPPRRDSLLKTSSILLIFFRASITQNEERRGRREWGRRTQCASTCPSLQCRETSSNSL